MYNIVYPTLSIKKKKHFLEVTDTHIFKGHFLSVSPNVCPYNRLFIHPFVRTSIRLLVLPHVHNDIVTAGNMFSFYQMRFRS